MTKFFRAIAAIMVLATLSHSALADGTHMTMFTKKGSFAEVKEAVEMAITGRGFVINNVSHIGEMLERTGKDLGGKPVFIKAEALEFCSASVSRHMMETDPDNIVFCPYIIAIYVLPSKPDEVRVAYRNAQMVGSPASQKSLKAVNDLLSSIIREAVE
ncbi:MAG: DUF302 domain-containing protein [Gallionellaceae bacterium]|jgi:uncharacterized protein (DUF302 family)